MSLSPEEREELKLRQEELHQELEELSQAQPMPDPFDKTERRQELLDELDEIRLALGEVEPEE